VAGLGTRFLPATKAMPKEMLPIVDKPLIQYAVEEAVAAGMTHMVFITGRNKRAIEDHFDKAFELETELSGRGRENLLELVRDIVPKHVTCTYVRQSEALGLGHAVLCARAVLGNEPFAVILADDLIDADVPVLKQMADVFDREQRSVIAVQPVPIQDARSYGIIQGGWTLVRAVIDRQGHLRSARIVGENGHASLHPASFAAMQGATNGDFTHGLIHPEQMIGGRLLVPGSAHAIVPFGSVTFFATGAAMRCTANGADSCGVALEGNSPTAATAAAVLHRHRVQTDSLARISSTLRDRVVIAMARAPTE
jgi:hypothetical protein